MSWQTTRPRNKYGNKKTEYDGQKFDSKKEMMRYEELKMLEKAGMISKLQRQVPFELRPAFDFNGEHFRAKKYYADFTYIRDGELIIEDVKSEATKKDRVYREKRADMAFKGWHITEV